MAIGFSSHVQVCCGWKEEANMVSQGICLLSSAEGKAFVVLKHGVWHHSGWGLLRSVFRGHQTDANIEWSLVRFKQIVLFSCFTRLDTGVDIYHFHSLFPSPSLFLSLSLNLCLSLARSLSHSVQSVIHMFIACVYVHQLIPLALH